MFRILRFIKNVGKLNKRLTEEEERQIKEGYSIKTTQEGPERYVTYYERERKVTVGVSYTYLNDVVLYTNSFRKWDVPLGQELTPFDYQKVLNRLIRYFACWGAVTLDCTEPQHIEDLRESLIEAEIPFEECEDGIIKFSSNPEKEETRKGGFSRNTSNH
ncbi:MAG: hypothetical protein ABI539_06355 [Acidobacteriota bacterium]